MKNYLPSLLLASFFGTSGFAAADTVAPVITSFSVSPPAVNVTSGDASVQVVLQITDNQSGFNYGNLYLQNANGSQVSFLYFQDINVLPGGSNTNGTYVLNVTVPRYGSDGNWKLEGFLVDNDDNLRRYGGANSSFPSPSGPSGDFIDVTNTGTVDNAAPQLASISLSPATVDVTSQSQTVTVTLNVTDDLSGFSFGQSSLLRPNGSVPNIYHFLQVSEAVGTPQNGIYTFTLTIPQGSVAGGWPISTQIRDRVGNSNFLFGTPASTIAVINNSVSIADLSDACDATQYGWTTSGSESWFVQTTTHHDGIDAARSGDIGDGQQSQMQMSVTGPGILKFWWKVSSEPGDVLLVSASGSNDTAQISGITGWTEVSLNINPGSQTVTWLYGKNSSGSAGEDAGWVDQVYFRANSDTELPMLQYINITPDPVNVSGGPVVVTVTFEASDDRNGVSGGSVGLWDSVGNSYAGTSFASSDLISGDASFGTYQVTFTINPADLAPLGTAQAGTWTVEIGINEYFGEESSYFSAGNENFPISGDERFTVTSSAASSTYGAFASTYFLAGLNALPSANPDSDWANNGLEMLLGLNPTLPDAPNPAIYQMSRVGNELRLDFKIATGLTVSNNGNFLNVSSTSNSPMQVTGQTNSSLQGAWTNSLPLAVGGGIYRVTLPISAGTKGFCRLMIADP